MIVLALRFNDAVEVRFYLLLLLCKIGKRIQLQRIIYYIKEIIVVGNIIFFVLRLPGKY